MMLLIIEILSTVMYIVVGILSSTRFVIKIKNKISMNIVSVMANALWLFWCLGTGAFAYVWTAVLYVILGIFSIINFLKILKNIKNGKEYKLVWI